jgi:rubrerythrin
MQTSARDQVLEIEVAGEAYYRQLAEQSPAPLDQIFNRLADEEHEHHETLEHAFDQGHVPELHHSNIVEHMHSICQNIREAQGVTDGMKSLLEVYANARDMEAKNRDHYLELAETEPNPETRKLWEFLAEEQNKHYMALDEMVQFVLVTDVWFHGLAW